MSVVVCPVCRRNYDPSRDGKDCVWCTGLYTHFVNYNCQQSPVWQKIMGGEEGSRHETPRFKDWQEGRAIEKALELKEITEEEARRRTKEYFLKMRKKYHPDYKEKKPIDPQFIPKTITDLLTDIADEVDQ